MSDEIQGPACGNEDPSLFIVDSLTGWMDFMGGFKKRGKLSQFSQLEPFWGDLIDLHEEETRFRLGDNRHGELPDQLQPLKICLLSNITETNTPCFQRVQHIGRSQWLRRGLSAFDVERYRVNMLSTQRKRMVWTDSYVARGANDQWFEYAKDYGRLHRIKETRVEGSAALSDIVKGAIGVAEKRFLDWRVALSVGKDLPSISLPTDPTGIKEIFRLREAGDQGRRKALLHWVTGHHRKARKNPEDRHWVKKHMRGQVSFQWEGMKCQLFPAPIELDPNWSGEELADTPNMKTIRQLA